MVVQDGWFALMLGDEDSLATEAGTCHGGGRAVHGMEEWGEEEGEVEGWTVCYMEMDSRGRLQMEGRGEAETRQQLLRLSALFNSGCLHGQVSREILAGPKRKADGPVIN